MCPSLLQVVAILKGHTKKVSCVVYHPTEDTVITASPDTQVREQLVLNSFLIKVSSTLILLYFTTWKATQG